MKAFPKYSVLMSVYAKEKPEFLRQSMESMFSQTVLTNDFVLVCDGLLTPELDAVIREMQDKHGEFLHIVRYSDNRGLGRALNEGLKHCKNELVARMDSDDISYTDRCEKQLAVFEEHSEVSVCSGIVEEFSINYDIIDAKRIVPETHDEIIKFARSRNPFNHPCVMYRKSDVEAVGSYQDFYLLEDYYLWIRMLMAGYQGYNIQEPLLHMRAGVDMYKRRAGWKYAETQIRLFRFMKDSGLIGNSKFVTSCLIRGGAAIVPNWLRKFMFKKCVRG